METAASSERLTVADAVEAYLATVRDAVWSNRLSRTTAANYTRDLTEFITLAGEDTDLADVTGPRIDAIVSAYGDQPDGRHVKPKAGSDGHIRTRGPGAQARFRQSVSRLFSHATRSGWVTDNPMLATSLKPRAGQSDTGRRRPAALTATAAQALVDLPALVDADAHAKGYDRPDMRLALRDEFLLRLMVEVGPRVSEIARANQSDMHTRQAGGTWLRLYGKHRAERWVPLSPATADVYARYVTTERPDPKPRIRKYTNDTGMGMAEVTQPAEDAERALVLTWRGRRMTPRDIQLMVARMHARMPVAVKDAVTPQRLRRTAATLLLASGAADRPTIQALLGQSAPAAASAARTTPSPEADLLGTLGADPTVEAALTAAIRRHPVTGDSKTVGHPTAAPA